MTLVEFWFGAAIEPYDAVVKLPSTIRHRLAARNHPRRKAWAMRED